MGPRGFLELGHGRDAELLVEQLRPLGTDARHVQQIGGLDRELELQFLVVAEESRLQVLRDLPRDRRAHAPDLFQPPLTPQLLDVLGQRRDALGGFHIRPNAVASVPLDREQPSDVLEELGDLFVAPCHRAPPGVQPLCYVLTTNARPVPMSHQRSRLVAQLVRLVLPAGTESATSRDAGNMFRFSDGRLHSEIRSRYSASRRGGPDESPHGQGETDDRRALQLRR
jgi:hypothetical protein